MEVIAKYSDYAINPIEFLIDRIEEELYYVHLDELTNNNVSMINVSKQHPLVAFIEKVINTKDRAVDYNYSNIIPAISVTPMSQDGEGFTLGNSTGFYKISAPDANGVEDPYVRQFKEYLNMTQKEIKQNVLLTHTQIEDILSAYRRTLGEDATTKMTVQKTKWNKKEQVNVSVWSDTPDVDILLGNIVDSIMAIVQGVIGDNSRIRNFSYSTTKGLTNFNYGRVLYGSEYILTFMNTYSNYIVYTDNVINGVEFTGTYRATGETETFTQE